MEERLRNIEEKLDKLNISVEHRLTKMETALAGIKWVIALVITGLGVLTGWLWKS